MDRQLLKKITTVSFLAAGALTYIVVNVLFKSLAGAFGIIQRWYSVDLLSHGLPVLFAATVFIILQFNPKILTWSEEVISEVSKVVWPSRKDTVAMTFVVCIFVGVASGCLIVIDFIARNAVQMILR